MNRRHFLSTAVSAAGILLAAPAIVRASSIMSVKPYQGMMPRGGQYMVWVAMCGSDKWGRGTYESPYRTINHAQAALGIDCEGFTITCKSDYREAFYSPITLNRNTTIVANPSETRFIL